MVSKMKMTGIMAALAIGLSVSSLASAQCAEGNPLTAAQITALVEGNTLCAIDGNERWQEYHEAGGDLWDYKRGPTSTGDPTEIVGSWTITTNPDRLNHHYSGQTFPWAVCSTGGFVPSFSLSGVKDISAVFFRPGGPVTCM